jgi:hypothetical protein
MNPENEVSIILLLVRVADRTGTTSTSVDTGARRIAGTSFVTLSLIDLLFHSSFDHLADISIPTTRGDDF